jgi:hypothetical protein
VGVTCDTYIRIEVPIQNYGQKTAVTGRVRLFLTVEQHWNRYESNAWEEVTRFYLSQNRAVTEL